MIRIISSLAVVLSIASVQAQTTVRETPKLVIGITIDQLRGDYLELFQSNFSERGFKRLLNEGLVYQNIKFDFPYLDDASAIATIYTGASPFYHGIIGNKKYASDKSKIVSTFDDPNFIGNYTQDKVSPLAIKTSTLGDELKIASSGNSDIYSFAPHSNQALITAGAFGNNAFWVDDYSARWASSTYYKKFYWVVDQENKSNKSFAIQMWGKIWQPLLPATSYKAFAVSQKKIMFQHSFGGDKETYKLFKQSPFVNEYTRETASKLLEKAELGKRSNADLLSLTFYAGNYPAVEDYSIEIQDAYIRLDKEIEKLLDDVDKMVGLKNTLIFVTSTGYYNSNNIKSAVGLGIDDIKPIEKKFYTNRCEALLNMYLMAIYGRDHQWVDKFYNKQIYLNRKLIKELNLPLKEIQQKAAEFITDLSGVQEVYTSFQIQHGEWNPVMEYYKNGFDKDSSGDLFVEIQPGYTITNEKDQTIKEEQVRNNAVVCPVIFFGNGIKPTKIKRTINATEIAPTVAYIMRIRSPNAAKEEPLSELQQ